MKFLSLMHVGKQLCNILLCLQPFYLGILFLIQHHCPWVAWDIVFNLKMLGKTFNRQYSEKAVLDEEIWGVNKSNLSPNYLPICHVNRTFVKLLKKSQQQTSHFSTSTATGLNNKFSKFGKDKEEDLLWIRFKALPIVFISVLTFIKTQGNNPSIALATCKMWHKKASPVLLTQTKTNIAAIAHLHLWNLKIWRVHRSSCFRDSWRRRLRSRLWSLLKPCQKRSSSCDFTLCNEAAVYKQQIWKIRPESHEILTLEINSSPKLCCRTV